MVEEPGHGIVLREGDVNLHTVACGGGFVWCGCATSPSRLVRLSPDLEDYETLVLEGTGGLHDLCWDGHALWAAHSSGHLSRIHPDGGVETFSLRTSGISKPFAYARDFDGQDIWIGMYTDPGCLLRFDRKTGGIRAYPVPEAPMWSVRDVAFAAGKVWAPVYDVPGRVVGVDPQSGDRLVISLGEYGMLPSTLTAADGCLWAGLDTLPARVVRIDPVHGDVRSYAFDSMSSSCRAMAAVGHTLWVALYTAPAQFVRLDVRTGDWEAIMLPEGFDHSRDMAHDGEHLFIGLQNRRHLPSTLYRLPLAARGEAGCRQEGERITAQDWYRVRRGEDQLAWGQRVTLQGLPTVVLSQRAGEEFAFLDEADRRRVAERLRDLAGDRGDALSLAVEPESGWRLSRVGELRVIFRQSCDTGEIRVATIRKQEGVSFDPENMGHPPEAMGLSFA